MATLVEESPEYAAQVSAFLHRSGRRRLPFGFIVAHGHLVLNRCSADIAERAEVGETAIALLAALGVSEDVVAALADRVPWNASPEELFAKFEALRAATSNDHPTPTTEEPTG